MTTNAIKPLGQMPTEPVYSVMTGTVYINGVPHPFKNEETSKENYLALRSYTEDCLARLRVAEKALAWYASEGQQKFFYKDSMRGIFADFTGKAREALATIGPLEGEKQGE